MARAPKLTQIDEREVRLSREYLKTALEPLVKAKLEQDGLLLRNPVSGATFNVYTVGAAEAQTGMVKVTFGPDGTPLHGQKGASWLVLHDPHANRVVLVPTEHLATWVRAVAGGPQPGWQLAVRRDAGGFHVLVHLDWAGGAQLSKLDARLKAGEYLEWRDRKLVESEDFVHLHNHSMYSLLDGASTIEGIAERALLNGQPGIALTDHGYMFGTFKHWKACADAGVKPLLGVEAYVVDDVSQKYVTEEGTPRRWEYHQTLIATNDEGWANLCHLMTVGCRDNYHYVPRIDHNLLFRHNAGIICLSGCFKGMAAHYLQRRQPREGEAKLPWWLERSPDRARAMVRAYKQAFGDRYYGEVMNIDYAQYNQCVPELLQLLDDEGVPKVMTNDCHYERSEDAILQAVMTRIATQKVDAVGESMREDGVYFIRSKAEMQAGAPWATDDMFSRTCEIMDRCTLDFGRKGYLFPPYQLAADRDWAAFEATRRVAG